MPRLLFSATSLSYSLSSIWFIFPLKKQTCQGIHDIIEKKKKGAIEFICSLPQSLYWAKKPNQTKLKQNKKGEQLFVRKEKSGWNISCSSNWIRLETFGNSKIWFTRPFSSYILVAVQISCTCLWIPVLMR